MANPKWFIFFGWLFLVGTIASGVAEYVYLGSGQTSIIEQLVTDWQAIATSNIFTALTSAIGVAWNYIKLFLQMLFWNYACFTGVWALFRILGLVLSAALVGSFIVSMATGRGG